MRIIAHTVNNYLSVSALNFIIKSTFIVWDVRNLINFVPQGEILTSIIYILDLQMTFKLLFVHVVVVVVMISGGKEL